MKSDKILKGNAASSASTRKPAKIDAELDVTGENNTLITPEDLDYINETINSLVDGLMGLSNDSELSFAERKRLQGSGVKRYGFIDKVSDSALENPDFVPPYMNVDVLKALMRQIETLRNITESLQQLLRMSNDLLLLTGDEAYRISLMYYTAIREAANRRVPGAMAIYQILQAFFHRSSSGSNQPTEAQVERDVKALLRGRKDGKVIVENERPHTAGGKHEVVDEMVKG
jgi:hypothetical protein